MNETGLKAAINTLKAGWVEFFLANLLGDIVVMTDHGSKNDDFSCTVTMRRWRGKFYMIDYKFKKPDS